jgi:5-(carboxyamino)imidazole ribonucleotide mutase
MPGGMPVATVAVGKAGATNAAYLALQILALSDEDVAKKLLKDKEKKAKAVEEDSKTIEKRI